MGEYVLLERARLYEQVAVEFRRQIVAGELVVGQRLPTERELASSHGVSRNVIREAVRLLVREGLVEVKQGSGTFVTDGTSKALGESLSLAFALTGEKDVLTHLLEARQIIEPTLASLAAGRASAKDISEMRAAVVEMDGASYDSDVFVEADHRLHLIIARASNNSLVPLMLDPIVDLLKVKRSQLFRSEDTGNAQEFHRDIVDAIERHDSQAAFSLMQEHLKQVGEGISRIL